MQTITRVLGTAIITVMLLSACASGSGRVLGNKDGSDPINETESRQYKSQLLKCYKTGGSRVVKIEGQLRCY